MAKQSGPNLAGTDTIPVRDLEVGINFDQWARDRAGFRTSVEMVTGGVSAMFGEHSGPEVGENYGGGLAEDRHEVTFRTDNDAAGASLPAPPGRMGLEGAVSPGSDGKKSSTGFGKSTLRAPQNYRIFEK